MDVSAAQQPSYSQQMSDTLHAQMQAQLGTGSFSDVGPLINLESNPQYGQPAWANLSLQTINSLLNGQPGGPQTVTTPGTPTTAGWYDANGNLVSTNQNYTPPSNNFTGRGAFANNGQNPTAGLTWRDSTTPSTTSTVNMAATPGLMSIANTVAQNQAQSQAQALTTQRTSDINDLMNLGPKSLTATANADPGSANIVNLMTDQAMNELNLGSNLTAPQTRTATQAVRANRQGMLGGTGSAGDYAAALGLSQYGQQLQQNRRQFATTALGARQGFYGNAFNNVLGRQNATTPQSYISQAQGISGSSYNPFQPESQYAANIYGSNQQSQNAANAASASQFNALLGSGISAAGSIGSAAMMPGMV